MLGLQYGDVFNGQVGNSDGDAARWHRKIEGWASGMQQADDNGESTRETVVVAVVVEFGNRFTMEKELDALPLAFVSTNAKMLIPARRA